MVHCACGRTFRDDATLGRHRYNCQAARKRTVELVSKREEISKRRKQEKNLAVSIPIEGEGLPMTDNRPENEPPIPVFTQSRPEVAPTRSGRRRFLPDRFQDFVPSLRTTVPHIPEPVRNPTPPVDIPSPSTPPPVTTSKPPIFTTECDEFGLFREYTMFPTTDPEAEQVLDDLYDIPVAPAQSSRQQSSWWKSIGIVLDATRQNIYHPFLNATIFRLMNWFYNGSNQKSVAELDHLVHEVILQQDFDINDLKGFSATRELQRMDVPSEGAMFEAETGWKESSVKVQLPVDKNKTLEAKAPTFEVSGIWHRDLLEVIRTAFQDTKAQVYHLIPFRLFWQQTPDSEPERIVTDLYNSNAFLEEHEKLQLQPREEGCNLERVIAAIMIWSDSTHLANFGQASLWPIYVFFGNQSKYQRGRPSDFAAHHLAYIPSLPDTILDYYKERFNTNTSKMTLTHLKRELMHAIWELILDDKFMEVYKCGFVIKSPDGVLRRFYPRIFTYSADYPEKVLLATIRHLGGSPCPRCEIKKEYIKCIGTTVDRQRRNHRRVDDDARITRIEVARKVIFQKGAGVTSTRVENILKPRSEVPTRNAFSKRLHQFEFNFFSMFVPDLLHEFELGVWKSTFKHLIRILYAASGDPIQELNFRYRHVPTFGISTIRRFSANASAMKKLAARDFEDLLQCSIPVFEGLLPNSSHNKIITDMLFIFCTWHAYAKLRLHTSSTIHSLDETTQELGRVLRLFSNEVCSSYSTKFLPAEEAARSRRRARKAADGSSSKSCGSKDAKFNMSTYKLHALGDYVHTIQHYATTDNYSTQVGELEHRRIKRFYPRTNKRLTFTQQISKHHRRQRILHKIKERTDEKHKAPFEDNEALPQISPDRHHYMSSSRRYPINILRWTDEHFDDPAMRTFIVDLKRHLLGRLLGRPFDGDEHAYSDAELATVKIINDRIYAHKVLRVNHTTYDLRRAQDSINPRTHPDIMLLAHEDENTDTGTEIHPYWYARVIGIYHAEVRHVSPSALTSGVQELEFLWVRWFGRDLDYHAGWNARRLHRIGFVADDPINPDDPTRASGSFSFIDPAEIVRGVHLIPAFAHGKTSELLGPSITRPQKDENKDWQYFYVNMFVDRDIFMRLRGGGIGHKATNERMRAVQHSLAVTTNEIEEEIDVSEAPDDDDELSSNESVSGEEVDSDEELGSDEDEENLAPGDDEDGGGDEYDTLGFAAL